MVLVAEGLDGSVDEGYDAEADGEDDDDGDEPGGEDLVAEGDGEDFKAEENEEDGVLELVDDLPEAIDAFVGDVMAGMPAVELAEGDAGDDGLEWG
jgi:hypothetical protein